MDNTVFNSKTSLINKLFQDNKKTVIIVGAVVIVAVIILFIFFNQRSAKFNDIASDNLSEAYTSFAMGNDAQGLALLNEVVEKYPKTSAAYQARLFLGDYYTNIGNFAEALTYLSNTKTEAKPAELRPLALARIIYLYDVRNEFINAKDAAEEFVKTYPNHFLTKSIYISLARYYAFLGSVEEVRRVCNEILSKFPATEEAQVAQNTLGAIGQ
ncbi:MAG: tetratricopeptide repeat protein [Elusimicrobiota bacterium]|jgi:predicted negative regulator of RcsB-dependent stress response|nr:tetratricopeptide repeat protein [Elusimicrobiota bacterium]